jgi:hypothetical protein
LSDEFVTGNCMKCLGLNLLICGLCLLVAVSTVAKSDVFVSSASVSFRISTEKQSYEADDEVQLEYRITNISSAPLYVPQQWAATCPTVPHIWGWFEDSSGNHLVPDSTRDCVQKKQSISERMSKEAVLLKPGEHISGPLRLDPKSFHLAPGRYRVEASMTGWAAETFSSEERGELEKMGHPFVTGEAPDSLTIIITGDLPDHPVDHRL